MQEKHLQEALDGHPMGIGRKECAYERVQRTFLPAYSRRLDGYRNYFQ